MTDERLTLDDVVRDSKTLLDPAVVGVKLDWERSEVALFERVEAEARIVRSRERFAGRRRGWAAVALVLAVAAAVPVLFTRDGGPASGALDHVAVESAADRSAGALIRKEGHGEVQIGPGGSLVRAAEGSALERGDVAEAHDAKGFFQRGDRVTWALEDGAGIRVRGTRGALILALDRGALEAQVTPVPAGEAFAVDVDGTRIAVHGTHLRVARDGSHVVVDLTEGVVSIGAPPRVGSTYGELVNAPAHIEFDAADPRGTMSITHDPARVRAALALRPPAENGVVVSPRMTMPSMPAPAAIASAPRTPAPPTRDVPPGVHVAAGSKPEVAKVAPGAPGTPSAGAVPGSVEGDPESAIASAVLACARSDAAGRERSRDLIVTVSSKLVLHVGDDGAVTSARFEPPLAPEVQTCASAIIYGARFTGAGTRTIPLDFQR